MYATSWCPDCHRSIRLLRELGAPFTLIDIEAEEGAEARMRAVNGGSGKVPTIIIGDRVLIEPRNDELRAAVTAAMSAS